MNKENIISSTKDLKHLMAEVWLRHKQGIPQRENNVFIVELPVPTPEETAQIR